VTATDHTSGLWRRLLAFALFAFILLTALAIASSSKAAVESPPPPQVWSDKADYAPGEQVTLSGANWTPGEAVHIRVNDDAGETWRRDVDVTAAEDGTISDQFNLPDWFVAVYSVSATGASSGTATWSFTDGNAASVSGTVTDSVAASAISGATVTCTSGCNNSPAASTTTNASGNYVFDNTTTKLSFSGNGPATLTLTVSKAGYTSGTITFTVNNNGDSLTGKNVALTPSDTTAPTTTIQCNAAACSSSYYNANVSVTLAATDNASGSGVKEIRYTTDGSTPTASDAATPNGTTYSGAFTVSSTATVKYRAFDNAGNAEAVKSQQINIDKVAPTVTASAVKGDAPSFSGAAAYTADTWTNKDVRVSFSCADALSGVDTDTVAGQDLTANTPVAGTTVNSTGSCTDQAGNAADASSFGPVKIDKTKPVITFNGQTPAKNPQGWNSTNVTLSWSCADALSGPQSVSDSKTISSEGSHQQDTGTCQDNAGNSAISTDGDVNIDKTKPSVSVTGVLNGATYTLGSVPAAGCSTTDDLSGVLHAATLSTSGGPVGSVTASCNGAEDNAGNANSASVTYTVNYNWRGFFQPVDNLPALNKAKAGSSIPVKFSLSGNQGLNIFASGYPTSAPTTCGSTAAADPIEETVTAGGSTLNYDATADQYVYVWKTNTSWSNSCRTLTVKLIDGTTHQANFFFVK
jgi:hypothetical protein